MRKFFFLAVVFMGAVSASSAVAQMAGPLSSPQWTFNATIIEACSCPMFCQCYFSTEPSAHSGHDGMDHRFCKFNNAFKVNHGRYGKIRLDGAKFWVAGDLGGDFSQGQMDWAVLTFDPAVTKEQREGIEAILGHAYPVKWNSFTMAADESVEWKASKDRAEARLGGGTAGEVILRRGPGMDDGPVVIKNLKYWGIPRNDGFVLMPNEIEAYRKGDKAFEFKGTNGFMITVDIASKDLKS